jgi:hypothetical protein
LLPKRKNKYERRAKIDFPLLDKSDYKRRLEKERERERERATTFSGSLQRKRISNENFWDFFRGQCDKHLAACEKVFVQHGCICDCLSYESQKVKSNNEGSKVMSYDF